MKQLFQWHDLPHAVIVRCHGSKPKNLYVSLIALKKNMIIATLKMVKKRRDVESTYLGSPAVALRFAMKFLTSVETRKVNSSSAKLRKRPEISSVDSRMAKKNKQKKEKPKGS